MTADNRPDNAASPAPARRSTASPAFREKSWQEERRLVRYRQRRRSLGAPKLERSRRIGGRTLFDGPQRHRRRSRRLAARLCREFPARLRRSDRRRPATSSTDPRRSRHPDRAGRCRSEEQRRAQENEAARVSRLFASTSIRQTSAGRPRRAERGTSDNDRRPRDVERTDRKLAFVNASVDRRTTSPTGSKSPRRAMWCRRVRHPGGSDHRHCPTSRSDHGAGDENVYDSPTGRLLLIPQGARLVGLRQPGRLRPILRPFLVWTRLIMPNGRSIVLERQGADAGGYSGLEDEVDHHWGALFFAAAVDAAQRRIEAGVGSNENGLLRAIRRGGSQASIRRVSRSSAAISTSSRL